MPIPTDTEFQRLFGQIIGILVDEGVPLSAAWVRAQAVVEEIRKSSKAVTLELTLSGIANDATAGDLRDRIMSSAAFSTPQALRLARQALAGAKPVRKAAREVVY